jgi:hypothetical protein
VVRLTETVHDSRNITPRRKDGVIGDKVVAMRSIKGEKKVGNSLNVYLLIFLTKYQYPGFVFTR